MLQQLARTPGTDDASELEGDEATGANIVKVAVEAPLKQIALNAGLEGGVVAEKVKGLPVGEGLNAATGEYVDLVDAGIIDPVKVTRSALRNAASIASIARVRSTEPMRNRSWITSSTGPLSVSRRA